MLGLWHLFCSAGHQFAGFRIVDARTIERPWSRFLVSLAVLVASLVCSLPSSLMFAAVPLQESHPVTVPGIEDVLGADRYLMGGQLAEPGQVSPGGTERCIRLEDHIQVLEHTPLVPATALCVELPASAHETGWSGYEALGDHARSVGNWSEAEHAYAKAIERLERITDHNDNQALAALLNKLGITQYKQRDFAGAEAAYRHALRIYTATQSAEDLRVANTLHGLAMTLFEQSHGRDLAGALFFRTWAVREQVLGPDDPAVAESLQALALSLYPDDLSKAVPLLRQAMHIRERTYGRTHPSVAETLTAIAVLYEAHHRQDLAIPLYQEALIIQEKVFGPNALETRRVRESLTMAHQGKGNSE